MLDRLNGSYENLVAGLASEAMADLTSGISETYLLEPKRIPPNLFSIMAKAIKNGSMIGCGVGVRYIYLILYLSESYSL